MRQLPFEVRSGTPCLLEFRTAEGLHQATLVFAVHGVGDRGPEVPLKDRFDYRVSIAVDTVLSEENENPQNPSPAPPERAA